jgi:hypothetical protein
MVMLLELLGEAQILISQDLQLQFYNNFRGRFSSGSYFLFFMDRANDVLGYAVAGVLVKSKDNPDPSTYGNDISSPLVLLACMQG